ncbi:MAG TPA: type I polyketide synthase, partial [Vicinamibacterales bacterium]
MAIAVIGLAGRFPGAADPAALWANLRAGAETISFLTEAELLSAGESPERLRDPDYVRASGRLADIAGFDAAFFGMSPRDAAVFDPQHRLFLECAWEAFEDAGYVGDRITGQVGVFASSGAAEYFMYNLLPNRRVMDSVGAWLARHNGNDQNFLATRVSYELNLNGPSMSVQTACSSSLVAVHVACQSLLNGECDVALAGGSTVYAEQNRGYLYKQGEILSPDGHCRAFDAKSAGTVMASAVGCVVLKRLADALDGGDRILAVIRGSAINNDGSEKVGYLAPSVSGQTRVISEALAIAGVQADDVSYVEAHGTATAIGDPIEILALTEAFRSQTSRKQFCAIGSLKTNLGHAGEAAGICSFIKTVLALHHREIPASLHYETPNPQIDFANSPFFVNTALRQWTVPSGKPRVAGVTSLGAGGTNVHVIVEEAPPQPPSAPSRDYQLLVLSAKTQSALDRATERLAAYVRSHPTVQLADVACTLLAGRTRFARRRALVVRDAADCLAALEGGDRSRLTTQFRKEQQPPKVFFMFPGGGAQYAGMGAELYARES